MLKKSIIKMMLSITMVLMLGYVYFLPHAIAGNQLYIKEEPFYWDNQWYYWHRWRQCFWWGGQFYALQNPIILYKFESVKSV